MIVVDTGPIIAMINANDDRHAECAELLATVRGPLFLPEPLLGEIGYLLGTRCGPQAEAAFIRDTVSGAIEVVSLTRPDRARVADLIEKYGDLPLGTADASVIAVAERFGVKTVATLDRRHFTVVRPRHADAFTLLP
ncbi:hypothetical protein SAMN05421504_102317 [Amycolatopsis xylanica]|uniref:Ribonuclease VapC n=1 Tax=Amycolatopsis xylanica TaxID=589385 RepID=A0A1H2Z096_9PSEU|nr:PIN domain-containing protein [Amycolatopsis xylanica]SDX10324.1 hypothetical protein SAMN05421504_102317 [Amycolatopsis xylanica]